MFGSAELLQTPACLPARAWLRGSLKKLLEPTTGFPDPGSMTYVVGVVKVQDAAATLIDLLVRDSARFQRRIPVSH